MGTAAEDGRLGAGRGERTVISIAHRLSTLRSADRVVVLSEGRVVEEGECDALLERGGEFKELVQRQLLD